MPNVFEVIRFLQNGVAKSFKLQVSWFNFTVNIWGMRSTSQVYPYLDQFWPIEENFPSHICVVTRNSKKYDLGSDSQSIYWLSCSYYEKRNRGYVDQNLCQIGFFDIWENVWVDWIKLSSKMLQIITNHFQEPVRWKLSYYSMVMSKWFWRGRRSLRQTMRLIFITKIWVSNEKNGFWVRKAVEPKLMYILKKLIANDLQHYIEQLKTYMQWLVDR